MSTFSTSHRLQSLLISTAVFLTTSTYASSTDAAAVLLDAERSVRSQGSVASTTSAESWSRQEIPASKFGVFSYVVDQSRTAGTNSASGTAAINSNITATLFSGSGTSTSSTAVNESNPNFSSTSADANATFKVTFQILSPTSFDLTALLAYDRVQGSGCCGGGATLSLHNSDFSGPRFNLAFGDSSFNGDFTQNIKLSGMLDPNTYTLEASAGSNARGFSVGSSELATGQFDFSLSLSNVSAVPLPGTVWMMLTGVMALASRRAFRNA